MTDETVPGQLTIKSGRSEGIHRGRSTQAQVFSAAGWVSIITGGLVAALTSPLSLDHGSWLAAYLVLVGGVAQVVMGWALGWSRRAQRSPLAAWIQFGAWNLGNLTVMGGTLLSHYLLVGLGSAPLLVALVIALDASGDREPRDTRPTLRLPALAARRAYQIVLLVLLASAPIGVLLSCLRHY